MPAHLAYPFIYTNLVRHLDEDQRLRVHAIMGDTDAIEALNEERLGTVAELDFEVG